MSKLVCFIDDDGQVATCVKEMDDINCSKCEFNDENHKKFVESTVAQEKVKKHGCVITEEQLDILENMDQNDFVYDMLTAIRSHPVEGEIKKAREDVIQAWMKWMNDNDNFIFPGSRASAMRIIESIRGDAK